MGIGQNVSKHFQSLVRLIRFALESRHKSQGLALELPSSDPSVCVTSIKPRILPLFAHCFFPPRPTHMFSHDFTCFHIFPDDFSTVTIGWTLFVPGQTSVGESCRLASAESGSRAVWVSAQIFLPLFSHSPAIFPPKTLFRRAAWAGLKTVGRRTPHPQTLRHFLPAVSSRRWARLRQAAKKWSWAPKQPPTPHSHLTTTQPWTSVGDATLFLKSNATIYLKFDVHMWHFTLNSYARLYFIARHYPPDSDLTTTQPKTQVVENGDTNLHFFSQWRILMAKSITIVWSDVVWIWTS